MRRVGLLEAWTPEEVWALIGRLGARTLVFDVEPLVAVWATDTAALDAGVAATLGRIAGLGRVAGLGDDGPDESAGLAGAAGGGPHEGAGGAGAGGELAGGGSADSTSTGAGFAGAGIASSGIAGSGFMSSGFTAAGSAGGRPGPEVVAFATNSARLPTVLPGLAGARVGYRASAAKPLRVQGFRELPRPGLVIGDQIATDGALAWRLGFDFVYYQPARGRIPLRPRLLHLVGAGLRPLLFEVPPFR